LLEIVITNSDGTETRYAVPEDFTYGEIKRMKMIAGTTPADILAGLQSGDAATHEAITIISAARVGVELTTETLDALPYGAIMFVDDSADERPTEAAAPDTDALPATTPDNGGNQS